MKRLSSINNNTRDALVRCMALCRSVRVDDRRGSVLLIVLVVTTMLALAAYTFTDTMIREAEAAAMQGRKAQTRQFANSAVEYAATLLGDQDESREVNFYDNPEVFQGVLMAVGETPRGQGRFSIVAPAEKDGQAASIRFGLIDESGKLNLNALMEIEFEDQSAEDDEEVGFGPEEARREVLMFLPGMTEEIADAILDFLDDDDEPRDYGIEDYGIYLPKNGPLESLDELLMAADVTPELLYGEDTNRNGLLDPGENDGELRLPLDNGDGILDLGWSAYLTVFSRESNLRSDGSERIFVNNDSLSDLFDEIEEEYDETIAQFVCAFRLFGPVGGIDDAGDSNGQEAAAAAVGQALGRALTGGGGGQGGSVTRAGLDLSQTPPPEFKLTSLYQLVGVEIEADVDGKMETLQSPWTVDEMPEYLPDLMDVLTISEDEYIEGRINLNQARLEVLLGIPGMTEELAAAIVESQLYDESAAPDPEAVIAHSTAGWLVFEGLTDLPTLQKLDRYLTGRGDVFRIQTIGYFDAGGPFTRTEAIIDATESPPKVIFQRDLSKLGKGYTQAMLLNGQPDSSGL